MSFQICEQEPLMTLLRKTFHANPLSIPEERIKPLSVIAKNGDTEKYYTKSITNLLNNTTKFDGDIVESKMANVSGTKTKKVDFELGFQVMQNFLEGMGINGATLKTHFTGAKKVSFSFENVTRTWLDIGELGGFLSGKKLNKDNAANDIFLKSNYQCLVLDSTIRSNNFSMSVEESSDNNFKIDVPAIQQYIGSVKTGMEVSSASSLQIAFKNETSLAFAFSVIYLLIDESGKISFRPDDDDSKYYTRSGAVDPTDPIFTPNKVLLYKGPGFVRFDSQITED